MRKLQLPLNHRWKGVRKTGREPENPCHEPTSSQSQSPSLPISQSPNSPSRPPSPHLPVSKSRLVSVSQSPPGPAHRPALPVSQSPSASFPKESAGCTAAGSQTPRSHYVQTSPKPPCPVTCPELKKNHEKTEKKCCDFWASDCGLLKKNK